MRMPVTLPVLAASLALLGSGCPQGDAEKGARQAETFQPTAEIPADGPLLAYGRLRLGMSSLDISQAYNAPEGRGDGFTRVIEDFGDAQNQVIEFEPDGAVQHKIVMRVYRDKVCMIVERKDFIPPMEVDQWFERLQKQYGAEPRMTVGGAQWSWGDKDSVLLTFTRDNSSEQTESANVVLVHKPSYDASLRYTEAWLQSHPERAQPPSAGGSGTAPAQPGGAGA